MRDMDIPRSRIEFLIDEWIFSERDRMILKRRLLDGVCFEPLAEEFNLSVRHIKTIVYKGENKIFAKVSQK
jgi:hypothetical protein